MLREMVVEEALLSIERGRPPRQFGLAAVADFVGVDPATIQRIETMALQKIKKRMI